MASQATPKKTTKKSEPVGFQVYNQPIAIEADRPQVFECSTDRAEKVLWKYGPALVSKKEWVTPASLLLAFITALVTADFRPALGLSAELWGGAFIVGCVVAGIWLISSLIKAWQHRNVNLELIVRRLYSDADPDKRRKEGNVSIVARFSGAMKVLRGSDKA